LSPATQFAISFAHHLCGVILFAVNALVCSLIYFDKDDRGKFYRKYLLSLQICSTSADLVLNVYSPIAQFNYRIVYANSSIANIVDIGTVGSLLVFLYGQM
ncbi:hypothetical protein PMAYCL1PPCAC_11171, partial [Pristionchus mayeri]